MALTFEELRSQLGKGTLDPQVEKFIIEAESGGIKPHVFDISTATSSLARQVFLSRQRTRDFDPDLTFMMVPKRPVEAVQPGSGQESVSREEYERLTARHNLLLSLLGEETVEKKLEALIPDALTPCRYILKFHPYGTPSVGEYATFFSTIDRLYRFLATFVSRDYFGHRWIIGKLPTFSIDHLLSVHSMQQSSPGQIEGTAIREIATSLRDVLSIGKQIEDIRLTGIRVAEAKLALERKQLELEEAKREETVRSHMQQLNLEVEKAKKELELEKLRNQLNEERLKQKRLVRDDLDGRLKVLSQGLQVLSQLPQELQSDVRAGLQLEVERLQELPFEFTELELKPIKD